MCFVEGPIFQTDVEKSKNISFEDRKDKTKKLGLCFKCLGKHMARDCQKTCYYCKGTHHCVLCKKQIAKECEQSTARSGDDPALVGISYSKSNNMTTVMQVVKTAIAGVEVNVMFDSGSDRSFITLECARKMKLEKIGKEPLEYICFGERTLRKGEKDVYVLDVCRERIILIGMSNICSTMLRAPVPADLLKTFSSLPLSEDYGKSRSVRVDILIGLD